MISRRSLANAIRILSIDAIQKARSGHPGTPMGMADIAEVLWRDFLNHNPKNPFWVNRDRFILSNGHGSMMIYSLLHLTGYDLSIEDLKNFRQLNSKTPGHPEYRCTPGIEATTGPLGQGLANAVGMAIAERTLAAYFNRPQYNIIDHYTYVFVSDGCMMEGISHEVCSLAGVLKLGKLIVFYDDNGITIDGKTENFFIDYTAQRFESYGWHVVDYVDGHNTDSIKEAISKAQLIVDKPTIIICKTIIGFGSPNKAGTRKSHGVPLGEKEIALVRKKLKWNFDPFYIPSEIYEKWNAIKNGQFKESSWNSKFVAYEQDYPKLAYELKRRFSQQLPINWDTKIRNFIESLNKNPLNIATRKAYQNIIEAFGKILPEYLGGSADLSDSNFTKWSGAIPINKKQNGNYIHYGVREFGMVAIANGIALHGGFLPYTATFLIFGEYARNAVRMAALMKIHQVIIYTHDSIGLGEDGPTHQPIEQISSLRMIPNISVWRPCDQVELAVSWKYAIERKEGPNVLILSRQVLIQQSRNLKQLANISRGGYILKDCNSTPQIILIATGSEVSLAIKAAILLNLDKIKTRVVSMPSTDIFDKQEIYYREYVLPKCVNARIVIEAGSTDFWYKYAGIHGRIIGMQTFGKSAPSEDLFQLFGFTVDNIIKQAKSIL